MHQPITIYTVTLADKGREHVRQCLKKCGIPERMLSSFCFTVEDTMAEHKRHDEMLTTTFPNCVNSDGKLVDFAPGEGGYTIKSEVI